MCSNGLLKKKNINSSPFSLLIINVKIIPNFLKEGAHLIKKGHLKENKDYPLSKFECFEHTKTFCIYVKL
jgi:hypothetical protein